MLVRDDKDMRTFKIPFVGKFASFEEVEKLRAELAHSLDILTNVDSASLAYRGNPYPTYDGAVRALSAKYNNKADWGCLQTRNVVDIRAAFIIGQGVKPFMKEKDKGKELEAIQIWMDEFNIDEEVPQDWAKEAEIEGKFLCRLKLVNDIEIAGGDTFLEGRMKRIKPLFVPWQGTDYKIKLRAPDDYASYAEAVWKPGDGREEIVLNAPEFVYKRFGGRIANVDETPSKVASALGSIEGLDKALRDWREVNHYFLPTPFFQCTTKKEAEAIQAWIAATKWNIGKAIVMAGEHSNYKLVGLPPGAMDSIKDEIVTHAKMISGTTGVPVHFLGLPDLMSNRAVAENLMELIGASTVKERRIWIGAYEEMFQKVLTLANNNLQTGFDVNAIGVDIPDISAAKIKELAETWLPLFVAGAISLETFLGRVPDIDKEKEMERLEEAEPKERRVHLTQNLGQKNEQTNQITTETGG